MTEGLRVFVNERAFSVPPASTVRDAVRAADPDLAAALGSDRAFVTDGVGRPLAPAAPVESGAIIRAGLTARRPASGPAA